MMKKIYLLEWEKDHEFLKEKLLGSSEPPCLETLDMELLRCGEYIYFWEGSLASSDEEAVRMAWEAAFDMTPRNGPILAVVLCIVHSGIKLETVEAINEAIEQLRPPYAGKLFMHRKSNEQGIRILLAVAEGPADEEEELQ